MSGLTSPSPKWALRQAYNANPEVKGEKVTRFLLKRRQLHMWLLPRLLLSSPQLRLSKLSTRR
jgi:hypothetical protein